MGIEAVMIILLKNVPQGAKSSKTTNLYKPY